VALITYSLLRRQYLCRRWLDCRFFEIQKWTRIENVFQ